MEFYTRPVVPQSNLQSESGTTRRFSIPRLSKGRSHFAAQGRGVAQNHLLFSVNFSHASKC